MGYREEEDSLNMDRGPNDSVITEGPYFVSKEMNEGFGNKVLRLLRIIVDNEEDRNLEVSSERLRHRLYGQKNESIAVEQLDYNSFEDAIQGDWTPHEELVALTGRR